VVWLIIHAEGARIEAHGLDLVAHDGESRLDLPADREVRVGRLVPGLDAGGPRLRLLTPTLSREHFILFAHEHRWYLRDDRSTGGTFINGGLVRITQSEVGRELADGDIVHLGAPIGAPWAVFRS
jgi:pSer/pThr/pTyr-binding forkhead associated (FHA) protein